MEACLSLLGLPEAPGVSLRDCRGNSSVLSRKPPCLTDKEFPLGASEGKGLVPSEEGS